MGSLRAIAKPNSTGASRESDDCDERLLLRRLAAGDPEAFWILWTHYRPCLSQVCNAQMGRHREDAEDALSEVMSKAREWLPREADQIRNLSGWLRRMAVNVCIDLHRRAQRHTCAEYIADESGHNQSAHDALQFATPAAQYLAAETRVVVTRAIDALPPRLRVASRLFFLDEAPYSAIASQLTISEPNARKRIQEARGMLQEMLERHFPERREPGLARNASPRVSPVASLAMQLRNSPRVEAQRSRLGAAFGSRADAESGGRAAKPHVDTAK